MRFSFRQGTPEEIVARLEDKLEGRKLGKMVSFDLSGNNLEVTIKKMGKSSLYFQGSSKGKGTEWELEDEKIALTHRAFKGEVLSKITKIVEQIGGEVIAS